MKFNNKSLYLTLIIHFVVGGVFSSALIAQNSSIKFDHLTVNDGLSQNTVRSVLQDSRGFMWFGTEDGLNKYDGYTVTIYKHDPTDSTTISDNLIRCLFEDQSGTLWIGTERGGLNRFNRDNETFESYQNNLAASTGLSSNSIWSMDEDRDGNLWIGTWGNGINYFDSKKRRFIHPDNISGDHSQLVNNRIRSLHLDQNNILWIGTDNGGLSRYDPESNLVENFQLEINNQIGDNQNRVWVIREDSRNNLWVGTNFGLNLFDRQTNEFTIFPLLTFWNPHKYDWKYVEVTSVVEDESGLLWIGTNGRGICRFDPHTTEYQYYQNDPNNFSSISSSGILTMTRDNDNLIWAGTNGGGIDRFNPEPKFIYYAHFSPDSNSLSHPSIRAIFEDRDSVLWVGSYGGLDKFDRKANHTTHYRFKPDNPYGLINKNVYSIAKDHDGTMWIGTEGGGLHHFNPQTEKFIPYLNDDDKPKIISGNFIFNLFVDQNNDLWIGTNNGISLLTNENKSKGYFINDFLKLNGYVITAIIEDEKGFMWIGTERNGLIRYDKNSKIVSHFNHNLRDVNTISNNRIKCVFKDSSGKLWIGTNGGGLNQFNYVSETFSAYTEKDGLPNDVIYGILEDNDRNLWLSTNKGLSKFNPAKGTFRNYDVHDGLQSYEFNTGAYFRSWTGEMFFGGINGLNAFFPEQIHDDQNTPNIVLTDFAIHNKSVTIGEVLESGTILSSHISEINNLSLSYRDRDFTFMFSVLNFHAPGKNQYAYKMDGFDHNWIFTNASRRSASYTHLPAGKYTFRVKGSNQDGVWNTKGISLPIRITPPFWKTWWAYMVYGIGIIGIFWGTIQWRLKQIKKRTTILEKEVDERTAELQDSKQKLQDQFQFLQSVIESLSQPFYVIDAKTYKTVLTNTAAKERIKSGKMHCHSLMFGNENPCSHSGHFCPLPEVKKTKHLVKFERKYTDETGKTYYAEINAYPIFDHSGNVIQMIEYWTDITDRKNLENTLKQNLENRNKQLTSKAMRMTKDREILIEIIKDVQSLYQKTQPDLKSRVKSVISKLNNQIESGSEWDEFELWFQEVHSEFYQKLVEICSDLTPREMKICAFLKLNLNTKEIASLANLTVKTIEVYRSQLRKKLNVKPGENLVKFISEL